MAKPHPATDYSAFEEFVEEVIVKEDLFVGFRLNKKQQVIRTTGERLDFTLIHRCYSRIRLVVDAKFYESPITVQEVQEVQDQKGHPFCAKHAALVFPKNCAITSSARLLAEEKKVMLVRLPVTKDPRYGWKTIWMVPWRSQVGYKVGGSSAADAARNAEWISGPYSEMRVLQILGSLQDLPAETATTQKALVGEALTAIPYREREIIKLRFGIGDGYIYSAEECARVFSLTPAEARELEYEAIRSLANLQTDTWNCT
jgi:hypothetical protein